MLTFALGPTLSSQSEKLLYWASITLAFMMLKSSVFIGMVLSEIFW